MHTRVRLELLFKRADRPKAKEILLSWTDGRMLHDPSEAQRVRFAALRVSGGSLEKLKLAIQTANGDYRDLLLEAGFASHPELHQRWWPGQDLTGMPNPY
jgi:hypothetical protein